MDQRVHTKNDQDFKLKQKKKSLDGHVKGGKNKTNLLIYI